MAAIEHPSRSTAGPRRAVALLPEGRLAIPVVLYLVAIMLPIGFYVGPIYLNLIRIVLLVTVIPLTLKVLAGQCGRILVPDIFFLLFVIWTAIATAINDPGRVMEHVGSTSVEFIGSYVLARAYIRTAADFLSLSRILVLLIIATTPIAVYELITNNPLILQILQSIPGMRTEWIITGGDEMRMGLFRVQAVFSHPIHYGMFCSVGFALCFVGLKGVYGTLRRYVSTAIITLCTFMSLSSGALLPVFLQAGIIIWAYIFNRVEKRWFIFVGLVVLGYVTVEILSNRPPLIVFASYLAFSPWNAYWRALIFEYGMQNVWANPWFGIGMTGDWVRPDWMGPSTVDNFWLVVAMRYGFPGILLLGVGYLQPFLPIAFRKFARGTDAWRLRRAWLIVFVGLTFSLTTVHVWSTLYSFVFFLFGAGMCFLTIPSEQGAGATAVAQRLAARRSGEPGLAPAQEAAPTAGLVQQSDGQVEGGSATPYSRFPPMVRKPDPL